MAFEKLRKRSIYTGAYVSLANGKAGDRVYVSVRVSEDLLKKLKWENVETLEAFIDRGSGELMLSAGGEYKFKINGRGRRVLLQSWSEDTYRAERCDWKIVNDKLIFQVPSWAKEILKNQQKK